LHNVRKAFYADDKYYIEQFYSLITWFQSANLKHPPTLDETS